MCQILWKYNLSFGKCAKKISKSRSCSKLSNYSYSCASIHSDTQGPPWRIMYFGSDEFAVCSLSSLCSKLRTGTTIECLDVTTGGSVDWKKDANPVRKFAARESLQIHNWPIEEATLHQKNYHIGIVVSFGHLIPRSVINAFPLGIINVHASILPRWRGAAPIARAIMNGDTETGITIMKIQPDKFDTGDIIRQYRVPIASNDTTPILTERLANCGAKLLMECVRDLPRSLQMSVPQPIDGITYAQKLSPSDASIDWTTMTAKSIYNLNRAIGHLYPLTCNWFDKTVKLLDVNLDNSRSDHPPTIICGLVDYVRKKDVLNILCKDGKWISCEKITVAGKKTMKPAEFYNGFVSKVSDPRCRLFT